jgi:hypothetical protein
MTATTQWKGLSGGQGIGAKWSLWQAGHIGLIVSAVTLLLQVVNGKGYELASYANTASAETIANLLSRVLSVPLLFVLIALVRNSLRGNPRLPSTANAARGAFVFVALLVGIFGALLIYGAVFFSSTETISGEVRNSFVDGVRQSCVHKQHTVGQNVTDAKIEAYCTCTAEQMANRTTYNQLGTDAGAQLAELKKKIEAAASACR